jgi:hypothetical protein
MLFLDNLRARRERWVDANRENDFESGILNLLTELYPDNAHFIYELLQNAEDARASRVDFTLEPERLIVEHDGKRLFTERDVDSITSIGNSTKRDDINQIGKFGIGFKAVFSYTSHPTVRSGDFAFTIRDLVVPVPLLPSEHLTTITRFEFPFDHPDKSAGVAYSEIEVGLWGLPDISLLFLESIEEVSWRIAGSRGHVRRNEEASKCTELIRATREGDEERTFWLKLSAPVTDSAGLYVALAFRLKPRDKEIAYDPTAPVDGQFMITSTKGAVSIYFPAEKETSGLQFHLHAPFAATVARDSVKLQPVNVALVRQLAQLAAEAVHRLKSLGVMDRDALFAFPNEQDLIGDFFKPVRDAIWAEVMNEPLAPTSGDNHVFGVNLRQGSVEIRELLDADALTALLGRDRESELAWAPSVPNDSRSAKFLKAVGMQSFTNRNLVDEMVTLQSHSKLEPWLVRQTDAWMQKLYALLSDLTDHYPYDRTMGTLALVRLADGDHVKPAEAFFAPEGATVTTTDSIVANGTYESGGADSWKERDRARAFLLAVGVRYLDEGAKIRILIAELTSKPRAEWTREGHFNLVERALRYWKATHDIEPFDDLELLGDGDEQTYWWVPGNLVLDEPYDSHDLLGWLRELDNHDHQHYGSEKHDWLALSACYADVPGINVEDLVSFAEALGMRSTLNIEKASTRDNPDASVLRSFGAGTRISSYEISRDWTIEGVGIVLREPTEAKAALIWKTMATADAAVLIASYRPNQSSPCKYAPSQLVHWLKKLAWVPQTDGTFAVPAHASREMLPVQLAIDDKNGWLTAIGLSTRQEVASRTRGKLLEVARTLGCPDADADDAEFLDGYFKRSKAERQELRELHRTDEEDWDTGRDVAPDPERRERKAAESASMATGRAYTTKPRSVADGDSLARQEAKSYLSARYSRKDTDGVDSVYCQLCHKRMPFRLDDGKSYFEAVELFKSLKRWHAENFLALCPTDAARFKHANPQKAQFESCIKQTLRDNVAGALNSGENLTFKITLARENRAVRFSPKHLVDLKGVLTGDASEVD